jgi:hypothetical protein
MNAMLRAVAARIQYIWRIIVLFVVLRLIAGMAIVALGGGVAWSIEVTVICAGAVAVYLLVALAVRRWAPPRRVS